MQLKSSALRKQLESVTGAESAVKFLSASESQVANYISNFESKVKYFSTLKDDCGSDQDFDLEEWLNSSDQSTIFLVNNPKYSDLYAVRISVFIESLVKMILSMKEDKDRRIYLYLDEMGSLAKMDRVVDFLALARSYGGVAIIGIQEIARIDAIYGKELRQTIVNNCSTKLILRAGDPDTAKSMSELVGEKEIEQTNLNSSVGTEQNRDGVSFGKSIKKESAVLPSEIMNLTDLEFYFKQPDFDWGHIKSNFYAEFDLIEDKEEPSVPCEKGAIFQKKVASEDGSIYIDAVKDIDKILANESSRAEKTYIDQRKLFN